MECDYLVIADYPRAWKPHLMMVSLDTIIEFSGKFMEVFRPKTTTPTDRLADARKHLSDTSFSRRDYLVLHKTISTATASRDSKVGVDRNLLEKSGG